jgi:hypothetical protein
VLAYQRIAVVKNYSGSNLSSVSVYMGLLGTELLLQVRLGSTILIYPSCLSGLRPCVLVVGLVVFDVSLLPYYNRDG